MLNEGNSVVKGENLTDKLEDAANQSIGQPILVHKLLKMTKLEELSQATVERFLREIKAALKGNEDIRAEEHMSQETRTGLMQIQFWIAMGMSCCIYRNIWIE